MIHHLFFPHHTNNHRAKILHVDALLFYVLLFGVFHFGVKALNRQMPEVLGYATDIHVEQLLTDTNARRKSQGLTPLTLNAKLSQAAAAKAQDMINKNYWAHNSPSGSTPWDFILGAGYKYTVAGENLAKNFSTSQAVVDAWMQSPTHRENIVKSSYKEIGFAVVNGTLNGEETTLVVQMFGTSPEPTQIAAAQKPQIVTQAHATDETQQTATTPVVTVMPTVTIPAETEPVAQVTTQPVSSAYASVTKTPIINIPTMTRDIVFTFAGVLLGVLLLDAWIVSRRRIVRVAGHNIAHFLFLSVVVIAVGSVSRGTLL